MCNCNHAISCGKMQEWMEAFQRFHKLNFSCIFSGITHFEFCTLKAIDICIASNPQRENSVKISEVVKQMQVPPSAVSRALKSLEEHRWVLRSVNKSDRRNTMVELTDNGKEILQESEKRTRVFMEKIFAKAGEEEIDQVIRIMTHIYDIAKSELELYKEELKNKQHDDQG